MAAVDDFLRGLLEFLGPAGILVALFLVFVIDAMVIPALPELAFVVAYSVPDPPMSPWAWGALLVGLAVAGEAVGNTGLYLFVQRAIIAHRPLGGGLHPRLPGGLPQIHRVRRPRGRGEVLPPPLPRRGDRARVRSGHGPVGHGRTRPRARRGLRRRVPRVPPPARPGAAWTRLVLLPRVLRVLEGPPPRA